MVSPAWMWSPAGASGICSATYFSPKSVLGSIRAVTLLGMVSTWLG
jgi:hypothetical protein